MSGVSLNARRFAWLAALIVVCLTVFCGPPAFGQGVSATLSGTVRDVSGAVVPNAKVVLTDEAKNTSIDTVSNSSGFFTFVAIQPGSYTVTVSAPGFASWEEKNVVISMKESRSLPNIALKVATATEKITVVAINEAIVPINTGETSTTLGRNMVANLGIQGRDAAELIKLMPGMGMNNGLTNAQWNAAVTQSNTGPIGQYAANGNNPYGGMQMTVDGGMIVDTGNMGTQIANINQQQTAELSIHNSSFGAEYSRGPVIVEATGKNGGSQFHGTGYLFTRAGSMNSTAYELKQAGATKNHNNYFYPGFDIGGPVLIPGTDFNKNRDKLFFYAGYEYMKQSLTATPYQYFVPTAQMLAGNFSPAYLRSLGLATSGTGGALNTSTYGAAGNVPCDPINTTNNGGSPQWWWNNFCGVSGNANPLANGSQVVNGVIPTAFLDPNSAKLATLFPTPNQDPASHSGNNYLFVNAPPVNRWEIKGRLDWNITQNTRAFGSYNRQSEKDFNTFGVWWWPSDTIPYPSQLQAQQTSNLWSASVVHVFGPSLTNETTFAYTSFINPVTAASLTAVNPATVGYNIANPFNSNTAPMVPNLLSWDCQRGNGGCFPGLWAPAFAAGFSNGAFGALKRVPSLSDNIAWVKGTHTLKFGAYWSRGGNQQTEGTWDANNGFPQGRLDFEPYAWGTTGNELADFVLGHAASFAQTSADYVNNMWYTELAFYASDQWKATRKLTLTFGIRGDYEGQWYPAGTTPGIMVFDPSLCAAVASGPQCFGNDLPGFTWHARDSKIPLSGFASQISPDPRVGAAYDLFGNGRTVLRGGFGVYRNPLAYNSISQIDGPRGIQAFQTNCNIIALSQIATDPACQPAISNGSLPGASNSLSETALAFGDNKVPYTENWNFQIDQRAPWGSVLEIAYVGSRGRNLLVSANLSNVNWIPNGGLFLPDPNPASPSYGITYYCQGTPSTTCVSGGPGNSVLPDFRPYNYSTLHANTHGSYSNYHALQMTWQKQTGRSTFLLNYTFSKVLGIRDGQTDNGNGNGALIDPFNMKNNYGVLAFDHTHIINGAVVIDVYKGFQLASTTQFQSGPPIQPNTGGNLNANFTAIGSNQSLLGSDGPALVPVLTCDPSANLASGQYFNPNCFAAPTRGHNGNIVWPYIKGPAFFNSDLSVYKTFKFKERHSVELRLEAFNFLNHPLKTFNLGNNVNLIFNSAGVNSNANTDGYAHYKLGGRVMEMSVKYSF